MLATQTIVFVFFFFFFFGALLPDSMLIKSGCELVFFHMWFSFLSFKPTEYLSETKLMWSL